MQYNNMGFVFAVCNCASSGICSDAEIWLKANEQTLYFINTVF